MRGFVAGVVVTLLVLAAAIYVVSSFGLFPIGADNPPSWLERRLAGRALNVHADRHKPSGGNPVAITSRNLVEGAREYEEHCALCHGGITAKLSPLRNKFNPPAPQLVNRIPHDDDGWLFWVTKHGVRMTGMPFWDGILSDDEMWKIIAFVKHSDKLPPDVQEAWQQMAAAPPDEDAPPSGGPH
jgi:mono/diheme cytochrome c family protein